MKLGHAARLFAAQALWRVTRRDSAGRVLIEGLAAEDEDVQTIAGILLTRAGRRAEPLLGEALRAGVHVPMVIAVLGSIGSSNAVPVLRPFVQSEDPEVARAARDAIRVIGPPNG